MAAPRAISTDVWNSAIDSASQAFKDACNTLKSALETDESSRLAAQRTAETDFRGYFAEVFSRNGGVRAQDNGRLCQALQAISSGIESARQSAQGEQRRIERAREWKREHDDWKARRESGLIQGSLHDFFHSEPQIDTSDLNPGEAPQISFPDTVVNKPELPAVGTAYVGTQTTAARPSDLDSFVTTTAGLNSSLPGKITSIESAYSSFESSWKFKSGDKVVSGMDDFIAAIRKFKDANTNDTEWIRTISAAFKAAGSDSSVVSLSNHALTLALQNAGQADSVHRDSLAIPNVQLAGIVPSTGYADDPVNTATGNFIEPETDLAFGGGNAGLVLTRMYNSLTAVAQLDSDADAPRVGVFGIGWSSPLDQCLERREGAYVWVREDGREIVFNADETTAAGAASGCATPTRATEDNFWLESDGNGWLIRDNDGTRWSFTASGQWTNTWLRPGSIVTVERAEDGTVAALCHSRGRRIEFEYDADRVVVVRASDGRRVEYFYNSVGHLTEVKTGRGSRVYTHDEAGLIEKVISASGVVEAKNTYDASGRVTSQLSQHGRTSRYTYLPGRVTEVADMDGTRANTWISDSKGRNIAVIDSDGNRHSKTYDRRGNLILERDRADKVAVHIYDDRGHRTRTVLPTEAELHFEWDDQDRIRAVIASNGSTTIYEYVGEDRDPSRVVDPYGGVTQLEWDNGLLMRVIDPEGVSLSFAYDAYGDMISLTNARGDVARLVRDHGGNIIESITPLGHTTRFTYDERGIITSKTNPDGGTWVLESDDAGQLTATIDPTGARTSYFYESNGEVHQITDPLGRVTTRDVDDIGNPSAITLPDGDQWLFNHDGLSRLKSATDPDGGIWRYEHNETGELVKTVDPTGVAYTVTGRPEDGSLTAIDASGEITGTIEFDSLGRPVKGTNPQGDAEITAYDACGRPSEFIDADGGLSLLKRDLAGRVISYTSPEGRTQTMGYDECGRLDTVTASDGARTTITYDADSRIIAVTNPAGETSSYTYDDCSRVTEAHVPGAGVYRRRYDKLGRIVYAEDPITGIRHFAYDAAGQLVKATNGLGGETRYRYDDRGRVVEIIDPRGYSTKRTYNALDMITSVEDPLGRTTYATYDAAGRQTSQTDGNGDTTSLTFGSNGAPCSLSINGTVMTEAVRDGRETRITDWALAAGGKPTIHTLTYDRKGKLIRKVTTSPTGNAVVSEWAYDRDGLRTSFTVDGDTSSYDYDASGRLTAFTHSRYGTTNFTYDATGRLMRSEGEEATHSWTYVDGFVASHLREAGGERASTAISRDAFGRPVVVTHDDATIDYQYNDAGQLVALHSNTGESRGWDFDSSGHMFSSWHQEADGEKRTERYSYDEASQLVSQVTTRGSRTVETGYDYDRAGQRTASYSSDGLRRTFTWDPSGWLTRYSETRADETTLNISTIVDGFGQVARVGDLDLEWDLAAAFPSLARVGDLAVAKLPGGGMLAGHAGTDGVWRQIAGGSTLDPYEIAGFNLPGMPAGFELTVAGPAIGGHVWMGERLYDPTSSSFLSVDPMQAPAATVWASNPYNYLANNPLSLTDPLGLSPITDLEVINTFNANASTSKWEYVAAGFAVVGGIALMSVGGPAAIALAAVGGAAFSAGTTVATQKFFNGNVNWPQVGVSAIVGGLTGGFGGWAKTASMSANGAKSLATIVGVNAGVGGVSSATMYRVLTPADERSLQGYVAAFISGGLTSGISGAAGPAAGTLGKALTGSATGWQTTSIQLGMNYFAGFSGSVTNDILNNREINYFNAGFTGGMNSVLSYGTGKYLADQHGVSTLSQASYFGVRSLSGLINPVGSNAGRLAEGVIGGSLIGGVADYLEDALGIKENLQEMITNGP